MAVAEEVNSPEFCIELPLTRDELIILIMVVQQAQTHDQALSVVRTMDKVERLLKAEEKLCMEAT